MDNVALGQFIRANRDELIRRCKTKVAARSSPPPTEAELARGIPMLLDQIIDELDIGPVLTDRQISLSAVQHGRDLYFQGFTIGQVVHDYGDVCQAVTDLAVEVAAPISTDDFRTLNRCLDDAIAGAVSEYARQQQVASAGQNIGQSIELRNLVQTALTAFEVLQTGTVGITGTTGELLHRSLTALRSLV